MGGEGIIQVGEEPETKLQKKEYFVVNASGNTEVKLSAEGDSEFTIFAVEVPTKVDYPLYTD
jgi:hypothetical protein